MASHNNDVRLAERTLDLGPIPTIEEIKACTPDMFIQNHGMGTTVAKVRNFVVKWAPQDKILKEGEALKFLAAHCPRVRVPRVHAILSEPAPYDSCFADEESDPENIALGLDFSRWRHQISTMYYLVMDYVEGEDLRNSWEKWSPEEKSEIYRQLRSYMHQIRSIPHEGYIGSVPRGRCMDILFRSDPAIDRDFGPFTTQQDMVDALVFRNRHRLRSGNGFPAHWLDFMTALGPNLLKEYSVVFTHGDFEAKNIMVNKRGLEIDVTIIDWESAGWYPEYWEFCCAMRGATPGTGDRDANFDLTKEVLDPYYDAYPTMDRFDDANFV